jgi:hypothetical protein
MIGSDGSSGVPGLTEKIINVKFFSGLYLTIVQGFLVELFGKFLCVFLINI